MKRFLIATALLLLLIGGALAAERSMLARVTVYWASGGSGSDKWTRKHQAATDVKLRNGHCAVDPRRIPYGSKVRLADDTLVAVDTGKHVKTRRAARSGGHTSAERNAIVVDRFFETKAQALAWAKRNPQFMNVRVDVPDDSSAARRVAVTNVTNTTSVQTTKKTIARSVSNALAASKPRPIVQPAVTATTTKTIASTRVTSASLPLPPAPPPPPPLRNSISTPRTPTTFVVASNSPHAQAARASTSLTSTRPSSMAPPASAAPKLIASNARQPAVAPENLPSPPSHYGRAVAYLP